MYCDVTIAGFGGQGIMAIGNILAEAAMREGKNVTYWPSYSAEMRGGTANCTVVISTKEIGSPVVAFPISAIIMNLPSLKKYQSKIRKDGLLIVNTSLIDQGEIKRDDVDIVTAPLISLAREAGNDRLSNVVALGIFLAKTQVVRLDSLFETLRIVLDDRYHHLIPSNKKAIQRGIDFVTKLT
ncbi:MAG: 2-oxoacid:acceptor oxidoreductase family protein [Desulfatiglandales bacterium]